MKSALTLLLSAMLTMVYILSFAADEAAGVKPETTAIYKTAREQVEKLSASQASKHAAETVRQAQASIEAAQKGLESGNDRTTRNASEMATLQARLAIAISDEKIASEKTIAAKRKLAGLENRLNLILAGKGEQP